MSSRQLRKLQKLREAEKEKDMASAGEASQESDEDEDDVVPTSQPRASLFAALGGGGVEVQGDDEDDDEAEAEDQKEDEADEKEEEAQGLPAPSKSKKKSKKKKKKKAAAAGPTASVDPEGDPKGHDTEEDEIDKAIKDLNLNTRQPGTNTGVTAEAVGSRKENDLLRINLHNLRAVNEMRNLFGRDVIESANMEEEQDVNRRHRQRGGGTQQVDLETFLREPPGAKKLPEVSLRRNVFIQGREHWPRQTAGGLTMKEIGKASDGSSTEYAYCHDRNYDGVQAFFFSCVQIGDPMRMVHLLKQVPYHVSTLLQVSSVAKQDQNMSLAAELCERALFTFGRVTTTSFRQNMEQGKARLDFRRPENRQFWLAGYHYLKSLIRKGTYRTALEWAKLLFSLDPTDPYAMRHYIPFLAIRAYESKWLLEFITYLESSSQHQDVAYLRQSVVLAKLQLGDEEGAREELVTGMKTVPWLYCSLFQELGLDAPPSIWGINADSDARLFWIKLYIHQMKELWNNPQATALLQSVAKSLDKVDTSGLPADDDEPDLGATRLAYLEGQTSLLAVAPRRLLDSQPNYEFDPLPPPEEENIFTSQGTQLPWRDSNRQTIMTGSDLLARVRHILNQQPPAQAAGNPQQGGDEEDIDANAFAEAELDDEELRRELDEQVNRGDEPGMMATLMRLLGAGRGGGNVEDDNDDDAAARGHEDDEDGGHESDGRLPGAWPDEG